jgi:predicted Zn-dependent peptidase
MENYKIAIDILYDIVCKPVFRKDEIATELKIVLEELSQTKDNLQDYIYEQTNMTIMPKQNIYNKPVIGNKEDLKKITVNDIKRYFKDRFGKVMLLVNCDVSSKQNVSNYMEGKFGNNKLLNLYDKSMQNLSLHFSPSIKLVSNDTYQYTTSIVFQAYKYTEVRNNIILGFLRFFLTDAGLYSILYLELREKRGLVYNVRMMNERFRYMGLMRLQFATSNKDTVSIVQVIMEIMNTLKSDGLKPSELEFFKKSYLSSIGYKFTNDEYKASWHGDNIFYGVEMSEKAFTKEIVNIKNKDIIDVCNEVFDFSKCGFFSLGTYDDTRKLTRKIKKLTNHITL